MYASWSNNKDAWLDVNPKPTDDATLVLSPLTGYEWRYDQGGWLMPGKTLAVNNTGQPERVLAPGQGLQIGGEVTVRLVTDGPVTVTQEVADRLCEQVSRQLGRAQYNARWQ